MMNPRSARSARRGGEGRFFRDRVASGVTNVGTYTHFVEEYEEEALERLQKAVVQAMKYYPNNEKKQI